MFGHIAIGQLVLSAESKRRERKEVGAGSLFRCFLFFSAKEEKWGQASSAGCPCHPTTMALSKNRVDALPELLAAQLVFLREFVFVDALLDEKEILRIRRVDHGAGK